MRLALAPLHFLALNIALSCLGGCAGNAVTTGCIWRAPVNSIGHEEAFH